MKVFMTVTGVLLAGLAVALIGGRQPGEATPAGQAAAVPDTASLEARVTELENALVIEREARQLLEDELFNLLQAATPPLPEADAVAVAQVQPTERRRRGRDENAPEDRVRRMVNAGIGVAKAEWILQRESELRYEALQIRYEAGRNGTLSDFYRTRTDLRGMLREEIGDADFERYLSANGMSTNVVVSSVLDASPAKSAGMQTGDRITRYNGERVYSMGDITRQIMDGTPGENIVLEFERDGQPMQVIVPRGPVGISGGSG